MKFTDISLLQYEADDGKVFDWKNLDEHIDEDGNQNHLYCKMLFLGAGDSIENYVEVREEK